VLGAVEALFKVKPLFDAASRRARATIIDRAAQIGVDWDSEVAALRAAEENWDAAVDAVVQERVVGGGGSSGGAPLRPGQYPSYYTMPFHAYPQGNLSLDAALEVGCAAASVHATVFSASREDAPDPRGDAKLREGYASAALAMLRELQNEGLLSFAVPVPGGAEEEQRQLLLAADLGAATGLSSLALAEALGPQAQVTGIDLSPHFVAVGRVDLSRRRLQEAASPPPASSSSSSSSSAPSSRSSSSRVALLHAAIEDTGLPSASFDVVSMCLVAHELPRQATRDVLREARRLLKPGGALMMMDMDPFSPAFKRIYASPFALAAFKSTEPWLTEYVSLDALGAVADAGFVGESVRTRACTPRHRAIVAAAPKE
jgi:SAM-dependent methyltransferase